MKVILDKTKVSIDIQDEKTGTNAFWVAAYFGQGECMGLLASYGADILSKHKETGSNALHIAIKRKHYKVAEMLINSDFPVNDKMIGGISPLLLCCGDLDLLKIAKLLIEFGADIN